MVELLVKMAIIMRESGKILLSMVTVFMLRKMVLFKKDSGIMEIMWIKMSGNAEYILRKLKLITSYFNKNALKYC